MRSAVLPSHKSGAHPLSGSHTAVRGWQEETSGSRLAMLCRTSMLRLKDVTAYGELETCGDLRVFEPLGHLDFHRNEVGVALGGAGPGAMAHVVGPFEAIDAGLAGIDPPRAQVEHAGTPPGFVAVQVHGGPREGEEAKEPADEGGRPIARRIETGDSTIDRPSQHEKGAPRAAAVEEAGHVSLHARLLSGPLGRVDESAAGSRHGTSPLHRP